MLILEHFFFYVNARKMYTSCHHLMVFSYLFENCCMLLLLSTDGKMLRVVLGLVVIGLGILIIQGTAGFVVAVIGLIPDLCSARGVMPHCSPLWVYIRGTEARVTGETGALVMGTCLSLLKTAQPLHKGHTTRARCCARQVMNF